MYKKVLLALSLLVIFLGVVFTFLYFQLPALLSPKIVDALKQAGCKDVEIAIEKFRSKNSRISRLECAYNEKVHLVLEDIQLFYTLKKLMKGELAKLTIASAKVRFLAKNQSKQKLSSRTTPSFDLKNHLPENFMIPLPISEIAIASLELANFAGPTSTANASFTLLLKEAQWSGGIQGTAKWPSYEASFNLAYTVKQETIDLEFTKLHFNAPKFSVAEKDIQFVLRKSGAAVSLELKPRLTITHTALSLLSPLTLSSFKANWQNNAISWATNVHWQNVAVSVAGQINIPGQKVNLAIEPFNLEWSQLPPEVTSLVAEKVPELAVHSAKISSVAAQLEAQNPAAFSLNVTGMAEAASVTYREAQVDALSFPFELKITPNKVQLTPTTIKMNRLFTGIALTDLQTTAKASYYFSDGTWDTYLEQTRVSLLGGYATLSAFSYSSQLPRTKVIAELNNLSLAEILALEGSQKLSGSGAIDGNIPIIFQASEFNVQAGKLHARPPGGHIVYRVDQAMQATISNNQGLELAFNALNNFHYTKLEGTLQYENSGATEIALRIEGRNPKTANERPIHFNITVTENLRKLLQSLRLAEDLGGALEKRMQKRIENK